MALTTVHLSALRRLTLLAYVASHFVSMASVERACDVTCTTDYSSMLNCSFSCGSTFQSPVRLEVNCSDGSENVADSCQLSPPQSWCVMNPKDFDGMTSIGTKCTTTVIQRGPNIIGSSIFELSDVVKPTPPFNVAVTNTVDFYNITWDINSWVHLKLTYSVRIRVSKDPTKDPILSIAMNQKYLLLDHQKLQPHTEYSADVQAKVFPNFEYNGEWSEWSDAVEWRTAGRSPAITDVDARLWYILFAIIPIVAVLLALCCKQTSLLHQKIRLYFHVSSPEDFFAPLYHIHKGNFQDWVNSAFTEYDYYGYHTRVSMAMDERQDVLEWCDTTPRSSGATRQLFPLQLFNINKETKPDVSFLRIQRSDCNRRFPLQDGCNMQGTSKSAGHISIQTVTLSGEEVMSQSSSESLRFSLGEDRYDSGGYQMSKQGGISSQHKTHTSVDLAGVNIEFPVRAPEAERASLDSFTSNEPLEDSYPKMDLDTIDSGFAECSSPGASGTAEQQHLNANSEDNNSNYVKQWIISSTVQDQENNLNKTQ